MKRRDFIKNTGAAGLFTMVTPRGIMHSFSPEPANNLEKSFLNPANSAKPGNMWFWMNGHVTKQGITLDLEAMARVGIGAVFNFDAGTGIPKGPLQYLSPEWFEMKSHALKEANRLGLEFCMHNCPGWSSSGGPWITPELSMKNLTWSETIIKGGSDNNVSLVKPPTKLDFYREVVVLAYPSFTDEFHAFADWEKRTNIEFNRGLKEIKVPENQIIAKNTVLDISKYMDKAGVLNWKAPAGNWTVLRFGYTSLGTLNRSAPDSGIGLECDKYDAKAIEFHFNKMIAGLLPMIAPLAANGKMGLEIDSFEVGMQNWTQGFETAFEEKNGYNLIQYLPAMTGRVVESIDTTERFLWDLRRTQADMLADNYYGKFHQLCKKNGILSFVEPYDRGPMEELQIGNRADGVMGEYWNGTSTIFQNNLTMRRTCKLAASIAHINGQKIVRVEGLTGEPESAKWQEYAFAMKPVCDKIFTLGINRILIHRNAHQPHPTAFPAMTMGPWGIQFDRTNTLWEANKPWLTYLTRCQSMLQQGLFVADLAYFTGEDAGVYTKVNLDELNPSPLEGYDYDVINAEILNKSKMVNSRLVLPDGMNYKILVLQQYKTISLALMKKIKTFVSQGLIIIGSKPETTPGLKTQTQQAIAEFNSIIQTLWGNGSGLIDNKVGNGRVFWGQSLSRIFQTINLKPDFEVSSISGDAPVKYIHRNADGADFYFVCNQRRTTEQLVCTFRVKGKIPELWNANTGEIINAPVFEENEGRTNVAFRLDPYGSLFVVFRSAGIKTQIKSIIKDNNLLMGSQRIASEPLTTYKDVFNNFTIVFWAKPELNIMLSTKAFYEGVKDPWTDYYTIYPNNGEKLYGKNHTINGIVVGRNGVAIWENVNGIPVFNTAAVVSISGWSHIAVVYSDGIPSIFVNGKFIQKGEKKFEFIHPALKKAYLSEGASYYNGDISEITLFKEVLSNAKISELSAVSLSNEMGFNRTVEPYKASKPTFLFWQNGKYDFKMKDDKTLTLNIEAIGQPVVISGSWDVFFPPEMGVIDKITLPELISLKNHSDTGVKYFSGTAIYRKDFDLNSLASAAGKRLFLDLGKVEVIAEVIVNGKNLGIFWTRPYLIDITESVKTGKNQVEIKVTNQWVNRLIGDEQKPEVDKYSTKGEGTPFAPLSVGAIEELPEWYQKGEPKPDNGRVTFSTWKHHTKDSPLLESGLIGPVVLREAAVREIG